jgi:predicted alpha/beta superfamily hydrolase
VPISDNYLRFLVNELKPFVDRRYRTRPEREFTFLMGSSMGGLISLYAICEYPHIFGGAGCLSTHWPIAHRSFGKYLKARLPEPRRHKIYLDYGDEANSAGYLVRQKRVEHIIREKGLYVRIGLARQLVRRRSTLRNGLACPGPRAACGFC